MVKEMGGIQWDVWIMCVPQHRDNGEGMLSGGIIIEMAHTHTHRPSTSKTALHTYTALSVSNHFLLPK